MTGTIDLALPIKVPGRGPAYGAAPTGIAVDETAGIAYVALYNANAVAVVDIAKGKVSGLIPVAYAPGSVALDPNDDVIKGACIARDGRVLLGGAS